MKRRIFISLLLVVIISVSASLGAFAASNLQEIKASLNTGLKFKVDGKDWVPQDPSGKNVYPITYNGTTYLPLRIAGDALGVDIGWDGTNQTVWLGNGASAAEGREAKNFNVDVNMENGPLSLHISKVGFDPAYKEFGFSSPQAVIILYVTAENRSTAYLDWYVNQSTVVLNTKEQIETTLLADDYITSEFNGEVVKKGKIIYPVKSSKYEDITDIRLITKYAIDENFDRVVEDKEITIKLK